MQKRIACKEEILSLLARLSVSTSVGETFFLDENKKVHFDPCFFLGEIDIREKIVYLVLEQIELSKIQNIAEFMFDGASLASIFVHELKIPCYHFNPGENKKVILDFNQKKNNFVILMGFTSSVEQMSKAIKLIEEQNGNVQKIISLIDEENGVNEYLNEKCKPFVSILTLKKIISAVRGQIIMSKRRLIVLEKMIGKGLEDHK